MTDKQLGESDKDFAWVKRVASLHSEIATLATQRDDLIDGLVEIEADANRALSTVNAGALLDCSALNDIAARAKAILDAAGRRATP